LETDPGRYPIILGRLLILVPPGNKIELASICFFFKTPARTTSPFQVFISFFYHFGKRFVQLRPALEFE
jgi:hypothetical protein